VAVRPIRLYGDPVLRTKAEPIEHVDEDVRSLAADMLDSRAEADGVGLAGPQVGASSRIIVVQPPPEGDEDRAEPRVFVNPEIVESFGAATNAEEGCLSIPGVFETVKRPFGVRVRATDLDGAPYDVRAEGILARILQHEIDHLDGVLFVDRIGPMRRALLKKRLREFLD
jgi:peptide deformylase